MGFPNVIYGSEERIFDDLSTERVPVGTKMVIEDGRIFRFTEAASSPLVVCNLNEGPLPSANTEGEVVATISAGAFALTDVVSSSATTAVDLMKYGYIYSDDSAVLPMMRIKSNNLLPTSGAGGIINLFHPTPTDIASGDTVSYFENPWRDVLVYAASPASVATGVGKVALTGDQYGWLQTGGPCSVLYDSTTTAISAVGVPVGPSGTTPGSVMGIAAATTIPIIGIQLGIIESTGKPNAVFLKIE